MSIVHVKSFPQAAVYFFLSLALNSIFETT